MLRTTQLTVQGDGDKTLSKHLKGSIFTVYVVKIALVSTDYYIISTGIRLWIYSLQLSE